MAQVREGWSVGFTRGPENDTIRLVAGRWRDEAALVRTDLRPGPLVTMGERTGGGKLGSGSTEPEL